jgi:hypothetical protein
MLGGGQTVGGPLPSGGDGGAGVVPLGGEVITPTGRPMIRAMGDGDATRPRVGMSADFTGHER